MVRVLYGIAIFLTGYTVCGWLLYPDNGGNYITGFSAFLFWLMARISKEMDGNE